MKILHIQYEIDGCNGRPPYKGNTTTSDQWPDERGKVRSILPSQYMKYARLWIRDITRTPQFANNNNSIEPIHIMKIDAMAVQS